MMLCQQNFCLLSITLAYFLFYLSFVSWYRNQHFCDVAVNIQSVNYQNKCLALFNTDEPEATVQV